MPNWRKLVQEPFFGYLVEGTKKIEGRLRRDDWVIMDVGDIITFYNPKGLEETFLVVAIHIEDSFEDLYFRFGELLLPNEKPDVYRKFFTQEEEEDYGVVGIEVKKISSCKYLAKDT